VQTGGGLTMAATAAMAAELGLTAARVSQLVSQLERRAERARETDEGAKTWCLGLAPEFPTYRTSAGPAADACLSCLPARQRLRLA